MIQPKGLPTSRYIKIIRLVNLNLFPMSRSKLAAVLLVDGYNAIGTWSDLVVVRDRAGLEAARQALSEALIDYSAFQGFETKVVFDAHYQNAPGSCEPLTPNLSICFTHFGQTADTYIEKACARWRYNAQRFQQRLIVATSDRAQQLTAIGYGAECMTAHHLEDEVKATARQIQRKQQSHRPNKGRFLGNLLDTQVAEQLAKLRMGRQ